MPAPSTATTVTSVSPIISAAAVDAVRPGLRTALAPASSPATPPRRLAGQPTTRASGLTMLGASRAMPANSPSTPRPSRSATAPALRPPAKTPSEIAASDARVTPAPAWCERAASPVTGSAAPSRTAAIGGTRVARRAGRMLASSVIAVPSSSDTMTVRGANDGRRLGQVDAQRAEQRDHALGDPEPETRARSPRRAGRSRGPRARPSAGPACARRRASAAWRTRACAGRL